MFVYNETDRDSLQRAEQTRVKIEKLLEIATKTSHSSVDPEAEISFPVDLDQPPLSSLFKTTNIVKDMRGFLHKHKDFGKGYEHFDLAYDMAMLKSSLDLFRENLLIEMQLAFGNAEHDSHLTEEMSTLKPFGQHEYFGQMIRDEMNRPSRKSSRCHLKGLDFAERFMIRPELAFDDNDEFN